MSWPSKHYELIGGETVRAVDGVSLSVSTGELLALYVPHWDLRAWIRAPGEANARPLSGAAGA